MLKLWGVATYNKPKRGYSRDNYKLPVGTFIPQLLKYFYEKNT